MTAKENTGKKPGQTVFIASLILVISITAYGILQPAQLQSISSAVHTAIIDNFSWGYLLAGFTFLCFTLGLAFSRYGRIKLGKDHEKPQFTYFGWFSMLFAAGMGIGLIFWGVAEPLSHYMDPPAYLNAKTPEAAAFAMTHSFFHWGVHPWAIYIVMSLAIAYFSFRRGMPPLISSCFFPLIGRRIYGPIGKIIDILAVFATVFGISTSLGLGALQIHSGISEVFGLPDTKIITIAIIAVVTVLFMISSSTGLNKGIQILSKANILIVILVMLFMFIVGPTAYILKIFTSTLGDYLASLVPMSLNVHPFQGYGWTMDWTVFYWAWWIAWSPFVGLFVATISRGRTIREFIVGVLLVPTLLTFFWFAVYGGAAFHVELNGAGGMAAAAVNDVSTALFHLFRHYPFSSGLSILSIVLLTVFFVTSADSATFVLAMMTSNGNIKPPLSKKLTWGILQSTAASVLLLTGGLGALQKMAIAAALPLTFIMLFLCWSLIRAFRYERRREGPSPSVPTYRQDVEIPTKELPTEEVLETGST